MQDSNDLNGMKLRTIKGDVSRLAMVCGALLAVTTGCDPCLNNPCDNGLACDGQESCTADGGQAVCEDGTPIMCEEGTFCTEPDGACVDPCADISCDDGDPCTTDICVAEDAESTPSCESTDEGCDDGDPCTENDVCDPDGAEGNCQGLPKECPEGESCDPTSGECIGDVCVGVDCDDGDLCTEDICIDDVCSNPAVLCGGEGETCNPDTGQCVSAPQKTEPFSAIALAFDAGASNCDDDDGEAAFTRVDGVTFFTGFGENGPLELTIDVTGLIGAFSGAIQFEQPEHDGVITFDPSACTYAGSVTNPSGGSCVFLAVGAGGCTCDADCDDGISCTEDTCNAGVCTSTNDDALCDDGQFCTDNDICDPTDADAGVDGCVNSTDPCLPKLCNEVDDVCDDCTTDSGCDDGIDCTDDTCDVSSGDCVNTDNCISGMCLGGADPTICD